MMDNVIRNDHQIAHENALTFILKAGIVKGVLAGRLFILVIEEKKKWQK
jgi:hypothetical protein